MKNYRSRIFTHLVVGLSLTACISTDSSHDPSCDDVPDTITEDIPNSVDLIIDDSTLPHEGIPHGVPNSYLWATGPFSHSESIPPEYHAMVTWGQVYEDVCENPASNTRVQIRDIQAYRLSKQDNQWHLLQSSHRVEGAAYRENFEDDFNKPADIRDEDDGSISVTAGNGYNFHFWTPERTTIDPSDIAAIWTTVQARLVVDDPALPDDRSQARYLLDVGGDLWINLTAEWDGFNNNIDFGMGRFKYVTTGWQSFNMLYMEGGLAEEVIRENPPPVE